MIIHITQKFGAKLRLKELAPAPVAVGAHLRWYGNVFRVGQTQYILTTNAASLFSVVIAGKSVTKPEVYARLFLTALREQLAVENIPEMYGRCIAPNAGAITFARTENRSVLGSMNDMANACKALLERGSPGFQELSEKLNTTPFSAIGYGYPHKVFAQLPMP